MKKQKLNGQNTELSTFRADRPLESNVEYLERSEEEMNQLKARLNQLNAKLTKTYGKIVLKKLLDPGTFFHVNNNQLITLRKQMKNNE